MDIINQITVGETTYDIQDPRVDSLDSKIENLECKCIETVRIADITGDIFNDLSTKFLAGEATIVVLAGNNEAFRINQVDYVEPGEGYARWSGSYIANSASDYFGDTHEATMFFVEIQRMPDGAINITRLSEPVHTVEIVDLNTLDGNEMSRLSRRYTEGRCSIVVRDGLDLHIVNTVTPAPEDGGYLRWDATTILDSQYDDGDPNWTNVEICRLSIYAQNSAAGIQVERHTYPISTGGNAGNTLYFHKFTAKGMAAASIEGEIGFYSSRDTIIFSNGQEAEMYAYADAIATAACNCIFADLDRMHGENGSVVQVQKITTDGDNLRIWYIDNGTLRDYYWCNSLDEFSDSFTHTVTPV